MTVAEGIVSEAGRRELVRFQKQLDFGKKGAHEHHIQCAMAHRQGVLKRTLPDPGGMCDTPHMQHDPEIERIREAVRRVMQEKGKKPKPLAKAAGLGETSVRDLLDNPGRDIRISTLLKLAPALDMDMPMLFGAAQGVPITGRIGAGGTVIYEESDKADLAPRPAGFSGDLEALEVVGESMLPRYSPGDVVYISRNGEGVLAGSIGEYCAIRLTTGETYVKQLAHGSRPGFYTLRSLNAADITDVEVEWATPILMSISRAARHRLGF